MQAIYVSQMFTLQTPSLSDLLHIVQGKAWWWRAGEYGYYITCVCWCRNQFL